MPPADHPARSFILSLPVADVSRSREFFGRVGFAFDPRFADGDSALMTVAEHTSVMLHRRERFAEFSKRPLADPTTHALAIPCLVLASRGDVDTLVDAALAAGGTVADEPEDLGFMYSRAFFDPDGHGWQVMWAAEEDA
ncbi:VOC family protein [Patulibacter sp. SYSU D01012]|uniref:VOC family protein n=1 Tax=Patulibacter sp. SYSU D01012 TaxID=2817381 RepID=UPI001B312792|nr:VOC family protein [Patulibacter sp. SYSU D01012]